MMYACASTVTRSHDSYIRHTMKHEEINLLCSSTIEQCPHHPLRPPTLGGTGRIPANFVIKNFFKNDTCNGNFFEGTLTSIFYVQSVSHSF